VCGFPLQLPAIRPRYYLYTPPTIRECGLFRRVPDPAISIYAFVGAEELVLLHKHMAQCVSEVHHAFVSRLLGIEFVGPEAIRGEGRPQHALYQRGKYLLQLPCHGHLNEGSSEAYRAEWMLMPHGVSFLGLPPHISGGAAPGSPREGLTIHTVADTPEHVLTPRAMLHQGVVWTMPVQPPIKKATMHKKYALCSCRSITEPEARKTKPNTPLCISSKALAVPRYNFPTTHRLTTI
jgi:hypothetical protein